MSIDLTEIESYIHEHIPITGPMGFKVIQYNDNEVRLWAPLQPNLNHRQTAFGGSVSALAILAGWTLLYIKLKEAGKAAQLVIQHSEIAYTDPIEQDFTAICRLPEAPVWSKFEQALRRYGKARVKLESLIEINRQVRATHTGRYAAICR